MYFMGFLLVWIPVAAPRRTGRREIDSCVCLRWKARFAVLTARRNLTAFALGMSALAVTATSASAAALGDSPPLCTGTNDPSACVVDGSGGDVTAAPKLIQRGRAVAITLAPDGQNGGIASSDSEPSIGPAGEGKAPRLRLLGCRGGGTSARTCRYRALSTGRGWQRVSWNYVDGDGARP